MFDVLCCRPPESESEDEDDMLTILLLDRKRRRRWFDTSRMYTPVSTRGNMAQVIWTATDEHFVEQIRVSRLQFLHIKSAVLQHLSKPIATKGRPHTLSPHDELLLFFYHLAQCTSTMVIRIASCSSDRSLLRGTHHTCRHSSTGGCYPVRCLPCNSSTNNRARL